MPSSLTVKTADGALARHAQHDAAAGRHELGGVVQDVADDLHQPRPIALDRQQLLGQVEDQLVPPRVDRGPRGLDGPRDDRARRHRLALQRDHPARDARHVEQVVDQDHQVLDLAIDGVAGPGAVRLGQLLEAQQLHGGPDGRQRIAQLVRQHRQEFVLAPVRLPQRRRRGLELRGARGDAPFELGVQLLQRARLAIQLGEDADLGPQDLGHDRHRHVVDGAALVAAQPIELGHHHGRHEDDRRLLAARVLADHRGQLVAVEVRHADVDQDDGDLVLQQRLERLARRVGADQLLAQLGEDGIVGEQLGRLIVDDEDLDRVRPQGDRHLQAPIPCASARNGITGGATSGAPTGAGRC